MEHKRSTYHVRVRPAIMQRPVRILRNLRACEMNTDSGKIRRATSCVACCRAGRAEARSMMEKRIAWFQQHLIHV